MHQISIQIAEMTRLSSRVRSFFLFTLCAAMTVFTVMVLYSSVTSAEQASAGEERKFESELYAPTFPHACERELVFELGQSRPDEVRTEFIDTYHKVMKLYNKDERVFRDGFENFVVTGLSDEALVRITAMFREVYEANARETLLTAMLHVDSQALHTLLMFNQWIIRLKAENKLAVRYALSEHARQPYGRSDHSFHLHQVRSVLKEFGLGPRDSVLGLILGSAAWLHDIFEDTEMREKMFASQLHPLILAIAQAVSKVKKTEGMTDEEAKRLTLEKIASLPEALPVKLADRIANLRKLLEDIPRLKKDDPELARRLNQVRRYVYEGRVYRKKFDTTRFVAMWREIERLERESTILLKQYRIEIEPELSEGGSVREGGTK